MYFSFFNYSHKLYKFITSKKKTTSPIFQRSVVIILLYSQLIQVAGAALAPATLGGYFSSPLQTGKPSYNKPVSTVGPLTPLLDYTQTGVLNNLSLTNQQLRLKGPVDWGVSYNDLTGTYFNAQYVLPLSERFAFGALGEYGNGQYRLNGTLGYSFSPLSQIKGSIERFGQRLPFQFDSGAIKARVHQEAYGGQFQQLLNNSFVQRINAGGYWAHAASKDLSAVLFTSNGFNCGGFAAGVTCVNYRHLAGATSQGFDAGVDVLLTPATLAKGNLYYDRVHYRTLFASNSQKDRTGLGFGMKVEQLVDERFKVLGEATVREIYDTYQAGFSLLPPWRLNAEVSLSVQRIVSRNATPNNNSINLNFNLLGDGIKLYDKRHPVGDQQLRELSQWVRTPAVKMNQVLVIAEQVTKLVSPNITGITPNSGPLAGGNTVTITGSNFMQGLLVFFGGQAATNVQVLSSTTIKAVVPSVATSSVEIVDVMVQSPDGQQAFFTDGYTYTAEILPVIDSINPIIGSNGGGTIITITGSNLGTTQSVLFGGIPATLIEVTEAQVKVTTPPHAPGLVSIVLNTLEDTITRANGYTYTSIQPPSSLVISSNGSILTGVSYPGGTITATNAAGTVVGTATVDANGNFSMILNPPQVGGGELAVTVTDVNGNISPPATIQAPDLTPPSPPADLAVDPSGTPLTGIGEPGSTVTVTDAAGTVVGTSTVGANGTFVVALSPAQTDGGILSVVLTDAAGNPSNPVTVQAPDLTPPSPPADLAVDPSGTLLTGTGEPGSTVRVTDAAGAVVGTSTVGADGTFTVALDPAQTDGGLLSVVLRNAAGNVSEPGTVTAPAI